MYGVNSTPLRAILFMLLLPDLRRSLLEVKREQSKRSMSRKEQTGIYFAPLLKKNDEYKIDKEKINNIMVEHNQRVSGEMLHLLIYA